MQNARPLHLLLACAAGLALLSGCPRGTDQEAALPSGSAGRKSVPQGSTESAAGDETGKDQLIARGKVIYSGTEYSSTGLTCAHCHAASPADEQGRIFIAHSGYGSASRGAWKITSQQQLDSMLGFAPTLLDAANACVGAPYMNHKDKLIEGEDAKALEAYLASISLADAKDAKPFIIARATALPAAGLTPDKAHGRQIYESSCKACHETSIKGLPQLSDAKSWLNPVQVMAKLRKLDGWFEKYEHAKYARGTNADRQYAGLLKALGVSVAVAEDSAPVNPCNPCAGAEATNPCDPCAAGSGEAAKPGEPEGEEEVFPENAMPFYGTDILSDQDVVDVAFFVIEGA